MANKRVPEVIGGVTLHHRARQRTNLLFSDLEESAGVQGLGAAESQIDRIRLIASRLFELVERVDLDDTNPETADTTEETEETVKFPTFGGLRP